MKIKSKKAKPTKIQPKPVEMRPCQPGDTLAEKSWENGVKCQIKVGTPKSHPSSGTTQNHNVLLTGYLFIPANASNYIKSTFFDKNKSVLGLSLVYDWGCLHGNSRFFFIDKETQNIKQGIQELTELLENEAAIVNGVYEAHHKSRKDLEEARDAIYAAYPVPVTEKESENEK